MPKLVFSFLVGLFTAAASSTSLYAQSDKPHENTLLHPQKFYHKYLPHLRKRVKLPDSLYIKTYPNYLSVGMHLLSPSIGINLKSRKDNLTGVNPSSKFRTNINDILGFSVSYRMVTAGFAFLTKTGMNSHDGYSPSRYRTATIRYNSSASAFQFKYLRIKGFTDVNPVNRTGLSTAYLQRPDIVSKEFQFENIYNFSWRKYSYVAPLTFTQRQVKTRAGFLLKTGFYYSQLSGDSALISKQQQPYYENLGSVIAIRALSFRVAPGAGANIILHRKIYLSLAAFTSADLFLYKYLTAKDEKVSGRQAAVFAVSGQASLGYQTRRLYAGIRYEAERRTGSLQAVSLTSGAYYTGIELGYRFDAPKIVRKIYKTTMPPGF